MKSILLIVFAMFSLIMGADDVSAQRYKRARGVKSMSRGIDENGDYVLYITLHEVRIFPRMRDINGYERMVRAVKKVYPLAIEASKRMHNLDEELAKYEKRKDQKEYTRAIEDALKEEISPVLWKMTRYEGKILLKLIDRETNHTAFGIIKDFRSGFTAGFYQMLAKLFGNDLKLEYDPDGEDAMLEEIVKYYKAGLL
ncbi:MAG: DUF4294 domain-containing protein [Alistipes sp.]|jgi:hypothetical protein|nr:DUF4294 domain-containing protein [Alistipes sp.]MEE1149244.1 DUF4294 domain-containing protein [Alistipes sp.]